MPFNKMRFHPKCDGAASGIDEKKCRVGSNLLGCHDAMPMRLVIGGRIVLFGSWREGTD
jgi:hypothetical protein